MDIESYPNYFLVKFQRLQDNRVLGFERTEECPLATHSVVQIIRKYELIAFNSTAYDIPLLRLALTGVGPRELKVASDELINGKLTPYQFEKRYRLPGMLINIVDLYEVTPGQASLKMYGARNHSRRLQDLPYEPDRVLSAEEQREVSRYCDNDLDVTLGIFRQVEDRVELRRALSTQYRRDLRSKSDAQIAEEVIKSELARLTGSKPRAPEVVEGSFRYQKPEFIKFRTPELLRVEEAMTRNSFRVTETGRIEMPRDIEDLKIRIGGSVYRLGMGGLHSSEQGAYYEADPGRWLIADWDVTSYYPSIILNCGLYPARLGADFLRVYRSIVEARVAAKRSGDKVKDATLKIVINGSFGKLGSPYSALYAPELMIQVTVTGQLALLMLIERMEARGIRVLSANTDGIVLGCLAEKEALMRDIVLGWERDTGFGMERTDYRGIWSRDVNNYIALRTDGKVKTKGTFAAGGLTKNPQADICTEAVVRYLAEGRDLMSTIRDCDDIRRFLTVRQVKGGAVWGAEYLGKTVRWYYSRKCRGRTINYKSNGNTVAMTLGARPLQDLPEDCAVPSDLDWEWYLREAQRQLCDLGVLGQQKLF